jgi:hypothetical protein
MPLRKWRFRTLDRNKNANVASLKYSNGVVAVCVGHSTQKIVFVGEFWKRL